MSAAFTPGDWHQMVADDKKLLSTLTHDASSVEDRVAGLIYVRGGGALGLGQTLATINARRATLDEDRANAAVMAASPVLYRALRETVRALKILLPDDAEKWDREWAALRQAEAALAKATGDAA